MPSIAAHMAIAKLVSKKLGIKDPNFIRGNLLPDITISKNSHHKIQGKYYMIPDINYFKSVLNLDNCLELGYFVHLLLDKYFLEDYALNNFSNLDVFINKIVYNEYDMINYEIVKYFNLDVPYLKDILSEFNVPINREILNKNLNSLSLTNCFKTKYLNSDDFIKFLCYIADIISEEIKDYGSKPC